MSATLPEVAHAAVFDGPDQPLRLVDAPLPAALRPGELLVRVSLATICGSDLHTVHGRRREPVPSVLGHEGVGIAEAAGDGRGHLVGRRLTWSSSVGCGDCAPCREHALPQKCPEVFKYGHVAIAGDDVLRGTYATHVLLRPRTHVVVVPDEVGDAAAAVANCALATAAAATEVLPESCRLAVVQGSGLLGLFTCALLREAGVDRVVVADPDPRRLLLVEAFGGEPVLGDASEAVGERAADLVIEACGAADAIPTGLRMLRAGGHYTFAGTVRPTPPLPLTAEQLVRGCHTLRGVHNYAPRHLDRAVAFLEAHAGALPFDRVVAPPQPLHGLADAFAAAAQRTWLRRSIAPNGPIAP